MRNKFGKSRFFFFPLFGLAALALFTALVMWLWNSVLVAVVAVKVITFWQALGILVLSKILFGGFRGAPFGRHRFKGRMQERWMNLSAEEKEAMRKQWREGGKCRGFEPMEPTSAPSTAPGQGQ